MNQVLRGGHLNHESNANHLRGLVDIVGDQLSEDFLRRLRGKRVDDAELEIVVSGYAERLLPMILEEGQFPHKKIAGMWPLSYTARYLWLNVFLVLRWLGDGGIDSVPIERLTNDYVDAHYVVAGSYCDRLISWDAKAVYADRLLRVLLTDEQR